MGLYPTARKVRRIIQDDLNTQIKIKWVWLNLHADIDLHIHVYPKLLDSTTSGALAKMEHHVSSVFETIMLASYSGHLPLMRS